MTTAGSLTSPKLTAKLDADTTPDYPGGRPARCTPTINDESAFQDMDQQALPYDGSPRNNLCDDPCEALERMGHLDMTALNAL